MNCNISNRIYYEINSNCNLNCKHCSSLNFNKKDELSFNAIFDFHTIISELGVSDTVITGGEPTLHPEFKEVASGLSEFGSVLITTNGTVLSSEKTVAILNKYQNISFQYSIDGFSQKVLDEIRGKGVHSKIFTVFEALVNNHLSSRCGLSMTIMKNNISEIKSLIQFATKNKFAFIHFPVLLPTGNAILNWNSISPNLNKQIDIEEYLLNEISTNNDIVISVNRIEQILSRTLSKGQNDCLTNLSLKISPAGEIMPCPISSNIDFSFGNIQDVKKPKDLLGLISRKISIFKKIANKKLDECKNCNVHSVCQSRFCDNCGLFENNEVNSIDYTCNILKHHYNEITKAS